MRTTVHGAACSQHNYRQLWLGCTQLSCLDIGSALPVGFTSAAARVARHFTALATIYTSTMYNTHCTLCLYKTLCLSIIFVQHRILLSGKRWRQTSKLPQSLSMLRLSIKAIATQGHSLQLRLHQIVLSAAHLYRYCQNQKKMTQCVLLTWTTLLVRTVLAMHNNILHSWIYKT